MTAKVAKAGGMRSVGIYDEPDDAHSFYVSLGKALADPTRLQILKLIGGEDEFACTVLEQKVPVSKSTISHHVKVLRQAGLITVQRRGKFFFYTLRRDVVEEHLPQMLTRL